MKLPISMFFLKLRKKNGEHNNLEFQRFKDKLGTRQLPSAEIVLNGARSYLVSPPGKGIKYISLMLNVTRLYNAATYIFVYNNNKYKQCI